MNFISKFDTNKIKSLIPELILFLLLCSLAYYLAEGPTIEISTKKVDLDADVATEIKRPIVKIDKIMERNLFSLDGRYDGAMTTSTGNPYTLVSVIIGNEKKAIFRDYKGKSFLVKEKEVLFDGYMVEEIRENSVTLRRDRNTKELTIFKPQRGT